LVPAKTPGVNLIFPRRRPLIFHESVSGASSFAARQTVKRRKRRADGNSPCLSPQKN
jgi:hypothetical protein